MTDDLNTPWRFAKIEGTKLGRVKTYKNEIIVDRVPRELAKLFADAWKLPAMQRELQNKQEEIASLANQVDGYHDALTTSNAEKASTAETLIELQATIVARGWNIHKA